LRNRVSESCQKRGILRGGEVGGVCSILPFKFALLKDLLCAVEITNIVFCVGTGHYQVDFSGFPPGLTGGTVSRGSEKRKKMGL
jgi:hypothetical protein